MLVSRNIDFIPGRDQGISSDNWQDMRRISMRTPGERALGYLHVSLATDGGNLHADNDRGHILVGIYDLRKIPAIRASAHGPWEYRKGRAFSSGGLPFGAPHHGATEKSEKTRTPLTPDRRP